MEMVDSATALHIRRMFKRPPAMSDKDAVIAGLVIETEATKLILHALLDVLLEQHSRAGRSPGFMLRQLRDAMMRDAQTIPIHMQDMVVDQAEARLQPHAAYAQGLEQGMEARASAAKSPRE